MATASVRLAAPSFISMLLTWNLTVERLTTSRRNGWGGRSPRNAHVKTYPVAGGVVVGGVTTVVVGGARATAT